MADNQTEIIQIPHVLSPDYRDIYADAFQVFGSPANVSILLGSVIQNMTNPPHVQDSVIIKLPPIIAKALRDSLDKVLNMIEQQSSTPDVDLTSRKVH